MDEIIKVFSFPFSIMYLISTELEPDDISLFNDSYNIIGIDKKQTYNDAYIQLKNDLKNKQRPPLFLVTRHFEKIYQVCFITKTSKVKDVIFNNQIEKIHEHINTYLYTKSNFTTYAIDNSQLWQSASSTWDPTFLNSFTMPHTLYYISPDSDFGKYLDEYTSSLAHSNSNWVLYSNLLKTASIDHTFSQLIDTICIINTSAKLPLSDNIAYGFNENHITPGSWVFLQCKNEIYGLLHITRIKSVNRINRQRFINNYLVLPISYEWRYEADVDVAVPTYHFLNPTKWGNTDITYEPVTSFNKPVDSPYLKAYVHAFLKKEIPDEVPSVPPNQPYNHFQNMIPIVLNYERIYILSTINKSRLYTKMTLNNEDVIYVDLNPSMFFKVNVDKWDKTITKQFLQDIKLGTAHIFLTTKKYEKIFMSTNIVHIEKYKSQREKLFSISPFALMLDHKYNADLYSSRGVLPLMIKAKDMWKINGQSMGQDVKSWNEISHIFKNYPERQLQMFSIKDTGDKFFMFEYLKNYLIYETATRANNTFANVTHEEIATYSDVISPTDYGLKLQLWYTTSYLAPVTTGDGGTHV